MVFRTDRIIGGFCFLFSSFSIIYSMFARLYSLVCFFSLLATIFWTQLVFERKEVNGKGKNLISWIGLIFQCRFAHIFIFSFVYVAGLGLLGLFYVKQTKQSEIYFIWNFGDPAIPSRK